MPTDIRNKKTPLNRNRFWIHEWQSLKGSHFLLIKIKRWIKSHLSNALCKKTSNLDAHTCPMKRFDIINTRQFRKETQWKKLVLSNISKDPSARKRTHTHELHSDKHWQAEANSHCYVAHMLQVHPPAQSGLSGRQIHWHKLLVQHCTHPCQLTTVQNQKCSFGPH